MKCKRLVKIYSEMEYSENGIYFILSKKPSFFREKRDSLNGLRNGRFAMINQMKGDQHND